MSFSTLNARTQCTMTLTGGGVAENHAGMQKIGVQRIRGFTPQNLIDLHRRYSGVLHKLDNEAYVWIQDIKDVFGVDPDALYAEHDALAVDKKKKIYGRVVNAKARYNLCYGDTYQSPSYENGRGTVIAFKDVPLLHDIRKRIPDVLKTEDGPDLRDLMFELNKYYNPKECGIGFHGDTERRIVIGFRLGRTIPFQFQAFHYGKPFGKRINVNVKGGQFYIMSEKAVGFDWKNKKICTWRHAAGAKKFRPTNEEILNKRKKKSEKKESIKKMRLFSAANTQTTETPAPKTVFVDRDVSDNETPQSTYIESPVTFKCTQCGIDMGPNNPRQLCRKTYCALQACD